MVGITIAAQAGAAVSGDVRVGPDQDAGIADEGSDAADARGPFARDLEAEATVRLAQDSRRGQEGQKLLPHSDRPSTRTSTTVGRGERLVDVDVHDIEAIAQLPGLITRSGAGLNLPR
jgi:hypothetical protein